MFDALRDLSFAFPILILVAGLIRKVSLGRLLVLLIISLLLAFLGVAVDSLARMDCDRDCIPGVSQSSNWFEVMILLLNIYLLSLAMKIFKGREAKLFMLLMLFGALLSFIIAVNVSNNS